MRADFDKFRLGDAREWEVPLFETDLPAAIMPLFVNKDETLHHIGTAFLISGAGIIATASHCIAEALRFHDLAQDDFPGGTDHDLTGSGVKLSVLHLQTDGIRVHAFLWSIAHIQVALPTDVAFGTLYDVGAPKNVPALRLSFDVPAPNSRVRAVGYPKNDLPPISLTAARDGKFDWSGYQPTLSAAVGQVRGALLQGCPPVKGPCLATNCPTKNGMSGGPVINEVGDVCGVVSASMMLEEGNGSTLPSIK